MREFRRSPITRRQFVRTLAVGGGVIAAWPLVRPRTAEASQASQASRAGQASHAGFEVHGMGEQPWLHRFALASPVAAAKATTTTVKSTTKTTVKSTAKTTKPTTKPTTKTTTKTTKPSSTTKPTTKTTKPTVLDTSIQPTTTTTISATSKPRGSVVAPVIVARAEWGADETLRAPGRAFAPIRKLIVHHTGSPNNPKDPKALIREAYDFHVLERGYSDIGYNFLIDQDGLVYEGRWARQYPTGAVHDGEDGSFRGVMGAHASLFNAGVCGVALIGTFDTTRPAKAAVTSLVNLLAWKASRHGIDATGSDPFVPLFGSRTVFPNIAGHRQLSQTDCPGQAFMDLLPDIRTRVKTMAGAFPPLTVDLGSTLRYYGPPGVKITQAVLGALRPVTTTTKSGR